MSIFPSRSTVREYAIWFGGVVSGAIAVIASLPLLRLMFKSVVSTYPITTVAVVGGTAYLVGTGAIPASVPSKVASASYRAGKTYLTAAYNSAAPLGEEFVTYMIDENIIGNAADAARDSAAKTMTYMYDNRQSAQDSLLTGLSTACKMSEEALVVLGQCANNALESAYNWAVSDKPSFF